MNGTGQNNFGKVGGRFVRRIFLVDTVLCTQSLVKHSLSWGVAPAVRCICGFSEAYDPVLGLLTLGPPSFLLCDAATSGSILRLKSRFLALPK